MAKGDHILVKRGFYAHHGISCGDGTIIHYTGTPESKREAAVKRTSRSEFADGGSIVVVDYRRPNYGGGFSDALGIALGGPMVGIKKVANVVNEMLSDREIELYAPGEVVRRAKHRISEANYNLALNNCEHFAVWCKTGVARSKQVEWVAENLFNPNRVARELLQLPVL